MVLLSAAYGRARWALTSLIPRIAGIQQGRRQNLGPKQSTGKPTEAKARQGEKRRRGEVRGGVGGVGRSEKSGCGSLFLRKHGDIMCGDGRCARNSFWNGELCIAKKYTQAKLEE